jgi:hypothetical protein
MSKNKTLDEKTLAILEHLKLLEALRAKHAPDYILKTLKNKCLRILKACANFPPIKSL